MAKNQNNSETYPIITSASFGFDSEKEKMVYSKGVKKELKIGEQEITIKTGKITKEEFEKKKQQVQNRKTEAKER